MLLLGRVASAVVLLAVAAMVLVVTVLPGLEHVGAIHVLDWIGVVLYVTAPVTWISAIVHWGTRFPSVGRRTLWGLVVVLGFVPGAIVYWYVGARGGENATMGLETPRPDLP